MKIKNTKLAAIVFCVAASCFFSSCEKNRTNFPDDFINIEVSPYNSQNKSERIYKNDGGVVCILYAESFSGIKEEADKRLGEFYGMADQGGKIQSFLFPDDFAGRISQFYTLTEDIPIKGILLAGCPSGTHLALSRINDYWDQEPPFNIISLFPKDDIDGQEANCSIVITGDDETLTEQQKLDFVFKTVDYLNKLPDVLYLDAELFAHAENIGGKGNIKNYVDPKMGIKSINHFVFEQNAKTEQ